MKLKLAIVTLIACLTCAVNSTLASDPAPSGLKADIEFAKVGDVSLTLDALVPEGVGPFPTCILVHGGGFVRGDKQSYIKRCSSRLARRASRGSRSTTGWLRNIDGRRVQRMSRRPSGG